MPQWYVVFLTTVTTQKPLSPASAALAHHIVPLPQAKSCPALGCCPETKVIMGLGVFQGPIAPGHDMCGDASVCPKPTSLHLVFGVQGQPPGVEEGFWCLLGMGLSCRDSCTSKAQLVL